MPIARIVLKNFTAFGKLSMDASPGVNILIGENGTGKTHVMKAAYALCEITKSKKHVGEKLVGVFKPSGNQLGRLTHRQRGRTRAELQVYRKEGEATLSLGVSFNSAMRKGLFAKVEGAQRWNDAEVSTTFIPVKEMLSHAPGFRSLANLREIAFDDTYLDIIDRAFLPFLRGRRSSVHTKLIALLKDAMSGEVVIEGEEFFLRSAEGRLEFSLLAEGIRKLGLIWILLQNGTLLEGSVLFWDEPEANLNPTLVGSVVEILLELQRHGVQVFLATHNYVVLKEFDLRRKEQDRIRFHALAKTAHGDVSLSSTEDYYSVDPNKILEANASLYERDVESVLGQEPAQ